MKEKLGNVWNLEPIYIDMFGNQKKPDIYFAVIQNYKFVKLPQKAVPL